MSTHINTRVELDFEQRARAVQLEDSVSDDEYATAAEIIFLRDANVALLEALKAIRDSWPAHGSETRNEMADAMAEKARAAIAKVEGQS
jgi:hypothetical protein